MPLPLFINTVGDPPIENQQSKIKNISSPIAWTIAGSDSGGGAGIQVDLKVMSAFSVHGCSVITAITAQNTLGVVASEPVSKTILQAQFQALETDLPPAAIKTGMLGSVASCKIIAGFLESRLTAQSSVLICDSVLKSTSGDPLLDDAALNMLKERIIPHATILTPNLVEAAILIGEELAVEESAARLLGLGPDSVLIKGGHSEGNECADYWTDGEKSMWLTSPRIGTQATHGTGCILSSAIASAIVLGQDMKEAVITGKTYLNQCLRSPANVGAGYGPMMISPFRNAEEDYPTIRSSTLSFRGVSS